jgi:hypothetical protein
MSPYDSDGADIAVFSGITPDSFANDIQTANQPAILKGLLSDWPMVKLGGHAEALGDYLLAHDRGDPYGVYVGPSEIGGHFFYGKDTRSENFRFGPAPLAQVLENLMTQRGSDAPQSIFIQSAELHRHMPAVRGTHRLDILPEIVEPRIWIGNGTVTRVHYDLNQNLICVVAGKRRVTLFPPEQLPNLYPGPFDRTIGGVPVGMVDPENPDLERYPRFALARDAIRVAELDAGDVLYIPYGWWHQVRSLSPFNVMINYWWDDAPKAAANPYDALFHAVLALRDQPGSHKAIWKALFDYHIFGDEPLAHLMLQERGTLGELTPERVAQIRKVLRRNLAD